MPLVAHSNLPTFERLKEEGQTILSPNRALEQDVRELHIGLLNMMPDAALSATERQFLRLVGQSNQIAQFYIHLTSLPELERGPEARAHIDKFYRPLEELKTEGLDALIITGANVTQPVLSKEPFWEPLIDVIHWAGKSVTSTLCSCLATHAVLDFQYGKKRQHLEQKQWGVYSHRVVDRTHPLVRAVNTRFDVPHSRFNTVTRKQFEESGLHVLVESDEAGVHMAVSADGFRVVFLQGHPEYDTVSLLKEYKREIDLHQAGQRKTAPPFPENYLSPGQQAILDEYQQKHSETRDQGQTQPEFPEELILSRIDNTWHDTAESFVARWIGKVYQLTHRDRLQPFMDGIDPKDPLDWLKSK